jgi:hypothetical protein
VDLAARIALRSQEASRERKWELYCEFFPPQPEQKVLDLGVSALDDLPGENYFLRHYPYPDQVTAAGINELGGLAVRYPGITFVHADGRDLPFPDGHFDVVHSNAVLEHVGPKPEQERFIAEAVRVSKAGFVTTPNRWFPIETHCRLPLLHWLPRPLVFRLADRMHEPDLHWWLLGAHSFRRMFPSPVTIKRTRAFGWPLTLIAIF